MLCKLWLGEAEIKLPVDDVDVAVAEPCEEDNPLLVVDDTK